MQGRGKEDSRSEAMADADTVSVLVCVEGCDQDQGGDL